ncbi:MAG: TerD family protein [Desulfobacterales bacterium]|nr:TerD family protein [Desulfobacterales bacterium]
MENVKLIHSQPILLSDLSKNSNIHIALNLNGLDLKFIRPVCLCLGANGYVLEGNEVVYHGRIQSKCSGIVYSDYSNKRDSATKPFGSFHIYIDRISSHIKSCIIGLGLVDITNAHELSFENIQGSVSIFDDKLTKRSFYDFKSSEIIFNKNTAVCLIKIYYNDSWILRIISSGFIGGFSALLFKHGVNENVSSAIIGRALKFDSQELKSDSQELKSDSQELKSDSQELKSDSQELKSDSQELKFYSFFSKIKKLVSSPFSQNKNNLVIIGQEGVGKTTLLASMYKEFLKTSLFPFVAANDTGIILENAYQKIQSIIQYSDVSSLPRLLSGTRGIVEYNFTLQKINFTVYDTAGGLIMAPKGREHEDFVDKLRKALVIINVIDGSALVEGNPFLNDRINSPTRIRDFLVRSCNRKERFLILFVITKCEAWLKDDINIQKLTSMFEERHKEVLNCINQNPNNVGIFIPVKTLGCVEYSHKKGDLKNEELFFKKISSHFLQENVDKPMMYALKFALKQKIITDKIFKIYGNSKLINEITIYDR